MQRIGVDVGGTFTDFTVVDAETGAHCYHKVPSTPADPSRAIVEGIRQMLDLFGIAAGDVGYIGHGTTVATNMVIEGRGVRTGLVTTRGFRDVLAIGRQTRPNLYDTSVRKPEPLVERWLRLEVGERLNAQGEVLHPLPPGELDAAVDQLASAGVEAVAVCFLHAYRNPAHERDAGRRLRERLPGAYVSLSSDVLPEFREYERTSTTVLNAYVGPKMAGYFDRLGRSLDELAIAAQPMTIHSNGGLLSPESAKRLPVATCLSGPAAGVMGAAVVAAAAGAPDIVTFDVGGTSTDVSLIAGGRPKFTSGRLVAGHPVKLPMIDIHVIGAGGGSIAALDDAGALKVGPRSAGASPGPVAYGLGGTAPTLTDANIVMQRLDPVALLDGRLPVDRDAACRAVEETVARPLGVSLEEAAYGILQVATANMSRALRAVTTEQGHDLAALTLFPFGGAGPLHASDVARECGMRRILVPQEPGTMCARGALLADVSLDFVRMQLRPLDPPGWAAACAALRAMTAEGDGWLAAESIAAADRRFRLAVDAHYEGQSHEIRVPVEAPDDDGMAAFAERFARAHHGQYGYDIPGQPVVLMSCRVQAVGLVPKHVAPDHRGGASLADALKGHRRVYFGPGEGWRDTPVYRRAALPIAVAVNGPAIIDEMSSTTVVLAGQQASIDRFGNIAVTEGNPA